MNDDPLQETDIYATEKKECADDNQQVQINPEETEMEDDISDVLQKSFTSE